MKKRKIIITGTHITPALELIRQLQNDKRTKWEIYYLGRLKNSSVSDEPSNESLIIPKLGVKFMGIKCGKFDRRWWPNTIAGIPDLVSGIINSIKLVGKIGPDIVVSFGGYVSVPVVLAAFIYKVPSITHEQTLTTSLSTKINSYFAKKVALTFDDDQQIEEFGKKAVVTGNLIRREIFKQKSEKMEREVKPLAGKIIFVTAGNQGSKTLNDVILELAADCQDITWLHQTGRSQIEEISNKSLNLNHHFPFGYIEGEDIGWVFSKADLVICRGGANTAQDIVALGKKTIMIPLPVSAKNEQVLNCRWVKKKQPDRTIVIDQKDLNKSYLKRKINYILNKKVLNKKIIFKANLKLKELIYEVV